MKERFTPSDFRFIGICVVLLAVTVWFSVGNFYRAFPEASIDFRVNREQGHELAARFLADQHHSVAGYEEASSFESDEESKIFLEREVGLETANRIMAERVQVFSWGYRWFRPLQQEEFHVSITPRGELASFQHTIPEDAHRPDASAVAARAVAESFITSVLHRDPAALEFVEVSEISRPRRVDRLFTWKQRDFELHDATYRLEIRVAGNEIGGYHEYLKIPDQWKRDYERLRSRNEAAQLADSALLVLLIVGLLAVLVMRMRRHDIHWRWAAIVGVAGIVLSLCSSLNEFTIREFNYRTTDSYSSFVSQQLLQAVITALGWGGFLFVLSAAAEPLYREAFGEQFSMRSLLTVRALRTKRFFLGCVLGITLTGIFIAYQTAFYIVAYRFGAWSPADVPYSDLLNTKLPWAFVLFGGFLPAVSEEFLFRVFAIPFLRKLARPMIVAVVVAGFLWGFGHAGYPQQPFYIRGVEVGIGGVALGLVMLRWGILPTLVWHYSVDAMYSAMLLIRSQSLYFRLSGAASAGIIVLPLVVALAAYFRHGGFEAETGLLNRDEAGGDTAPEPADEPPVPGDTAFGREYRPLSTRTRLAAIAVFAIGLLMLLAPVARFGESPRYRISDDRAHAAADEFLRAQGLQPETFRNVTFPSARWSGNDSLAAKYVLEREPVAAASRLFEEYRPVRVWSSRYFKSLDQEEINVAVHPETGKILGFDHTVPEDRAGAALSGASARSVAAEFARSQGVDVDAMQLKEESSAQKKARRDHTLEWEAAAGDRRNVDEARFRIHAEVAGDRVSEFRGYWKIPEAYSRVRSRQNFISIATLVLRFSVIGAGVMAGILLLVQYIRKGHVPWRQVLRIAIPISLLSTLGPLLARRVLLQNYNTAIPLETYTAMTYVVVAMSGVFAFLIVGGAMALILSGFPDSLDALRSSARRILGFDALFALGAAAGLILLLQRLTAMLQGAFPSAALFSISAPELIISTAPGIAVLSGVLRSTIVSAAMVAIGALSLRRLEGRPWAPPLIVLLTAFVPMSVGMRTAGEFALEYALGLAAVLAAIAFCLFFARGNYLAYALVLWFLAFRGALTDLFGTPIPALQIQGWILVAVLAATLAWLVFPVFARQPAAVEVKNS